MRPVTIEDAERILNAYLARCSKPLAPKERVPKQAELLLDVMIEKNVVINEEVKDETAGAGKP